MHLYFYNNNFLLDPNVYESAFDMSVLFELLLPPGTGVADGIPSRGVGIRGAKCFPHRDSPGISGDPAAHLAGRAK